MKRNLNDILLEVRKVPITDEHEIMACINRLGNRTISSLLENIIEEHIQCSDVRCDTMM